MIFETNLKPEIMRRIKRIKLVFLFVLFSATSIFGQTTITIGTGTSSYYIIPTDGYYDYNWSAELFLQSEINQTGDITKIAYYVATK